MPKFVLGEQYAHSLVTLDSIFIYSVFFYVINTVAYFAVFSLLSLLFRAFDIIQLPLAASNTVSLILLSIKMPKWRFGAEIENLRFNARAARTRWCIIITLPAAFAVTSVSFAELNFGVQLMVLLVNSFHLECMLVFSKTSKR